jgi:outer membrane protein assembly factor BamB
VSVHNGVVYASTGEGWVVAYEAEAGTLLWSRPLHSSYQKGRPLGIINTPPVPTAHGLLVANVLRPQQLLDYDTGQEKATLPADVGSYSSFAAIDGGIMYCVRRGKATAMTFPGGKVKWELEETSRSTSPPVVAGGKLLYSSSGYMTARDTATGEILWRVGHAHAGYQNAIPAVWDNQVLVNGTNFRSLDLETGKENWLVPCGQEMDRFVRSRRQAIGGSSSPMVAGDLAFFGHDDTSVRAVNSEGTVAWEHRLGTPIKTAPLVTGNLLLVHDFAGNLWCFSGGK